MKWISNELTQQVIINFKDLIPNDFDYKKYILLNPDLISAEIDNEQKAKEHYLLYGRKENRQYKQNILVSKEEIKTEFWNNGKNILYFSPMAPDFDTSSGGNRLLEILKILKDLEYNVWFLCNGYSDKKHLEVLEKLNINYFLPNISKNEYLDKYLLDAKNKNLVFDNAIFSWYDIANQYINIVKNYYPNIKILMDSVDIHWIREQRGKNTGQLNISQESIDLRKNIEKNVYKNADVIFAITENDKKHLEQEIGYGFNIKILSNIHDQNNVSLGKDMFFIGNYSHGPNMDAAKRCLEIYKIFQKTPEFQKLKIKPKMLFAGPNLPVDMQKEILSTDNAKYLGKIENLKDLYSQSCLLISPLSWGAGIKGKICDAGMAGIPILTSSIGNEGINFTHRKNALIANNKSDFVSELIFFFGLSKKNKKNIGILGQKHLSSIVSKKAASNVIKHSLQDKHVVISIVTYNQLEKLNKCISKILNRTSYRNYTIYITDNSNGTEIRDILFKNYSSYLNSKKIIYHKNKQNKYFIEPNNEVFLRKEYKFSDFVLVNDDIEIINGNWLSHLYSSAYSADYIAACGGKTIYPNGLIAEAGAEIYSNGDGKNIGRYEDPNKPEYNKQKYVGYCSGCLLYIRNDAINKIGVFSANLNKLYYEDSDWQYRAHFYGLKTIYDHRCAAIHNEGSTSGSDISKGAKKYQKINKEIFLENMINLGINNIEDFNE
jgi:O-antigen biosynthesis protein